MPLFECSTMTTTPRNRALSTQLCEIHLKTTFVSIERLHTELMLAFADATHVIFPKTRMPSSVHFNRSSSTLPKGPQFLNGSSLLETREALGHAIRNLLTQAVKDVGILQLIDEFVGQSQRTGCAGHTTWRKTAPSQHKPVRGIVANLQGDSAAFVRITKPLTACGAPHATWLLRPSFRLAIIIHIEQTDAASGSSATRLTCVHCGERIYTLRQPAQNKHRAYPHPLFSTMILTMSSKNASSSSNYQDLLELALLGQQHPSVTSPVSHASLHLESRNAIMCPRLESDHCSATHLSNKPHRNVQSGQHPGSRPPTT